MKTEALTIVCILVALTCFSHADPVFHSKVTQEKQMRTTTLFKGKEMVMKRLEFDSKSTGNFDRTSEQFYSDGKVVFCYSHFLPAPPSRIYYASGLFILSGSLEGDSREVLLIGLPDDKNFQAYVLENGAHRPMTVAEINHIRELTNAWAQLLPKFPK